MKKATYVVTSLATLLCLLSGNAFAQTTLTRRNLPVPKRVPPKLLHIHISKRINTKKPVSVPNTKTTTTATKQKK